MTRFSALMILLLLGVALPFIVQPAVADAAPTDVVINEFLAVNESTLADNTGEFEDWVELRNTTGSTVDLTGWVLTAGGDAFVFPSGTSISAGGYFLVWASGDATRTTANELHVPFKLASDGELLTLVDPNGALSEPSWPAGYPIQVEDDSYGIASGGQIRYFTSPTPGSANGGGIGNGLIEPVTFSLDHGFYSGNQTLVLDTPSSGATIRYTTNGDVPTNSIGTQVAPGTAITISETSTIRAVAFQSAAITSPVETRTYLFTNDIVDQTKPAEWPSGPVNDQILDFDMDPNVVNANPAAVAASLTAIPSISIVTDLDNLVDPDEGIYVNALERGSEWERQASVELIDPTGAQEGFDIEAGIRIRGGFSRRAENPKHALRLFFDNDYEGELNYPLFGDEAGDKFERIDLRTSSNFGWAFRGRTDSSFIDEVWSRDTQAAMGQPYTRSRQYHLYLNGVYWGLYMTQERVSDDYGETYFGGDSDDYDIVKRNAPASDTEATAGTDVAWKSLFPLVSDLQVTNAEFNQLDAQVDLVNLADYYLLHFFSGDYDGSPSWFQGRYERSNNWYALRNRNGTGEAGKWQFFDHDSEHSLCANDGPRAGAQVDNTTPWNFDPVELGDNFMAPAFLHAALITNPAYVQIFRDRVDLHMLTPGGALTLPENEARLDARAAEVSPAIEAVSARWGDSTTEPPLGRSDWESGVERIRNCLEDRRSIVQAQLTDDGLWPVTDAPVISPASGALPFGTAITVDDLGQGGTIYYTTNGSDPSNTNGTVRDSAIEYTGPISLTGDLVLNVRVRIGAEWTPLATANYSLSSVPGPIGLVLNEFNAVSAGNFLGDLGTDASLGTVAGNGGDWFELMVVDDQLDIRGWTFEVWNDDNGILTQNASLTLSNDAVFTDLLSGSILTVSEDIADDVSYNPLQRDWHINVQSNNAGAGAYVTGASQSNFSINNDDTQIAIFDAAGIPVQLRTGEGTAPEASVSSSEVFKLEGTPTTSLTPDSELYDDGTSSSWGLPNIFSGGAETQDLSDLRLTFGDANCDGNISITDAIFIAQFTVGNRVGASCPLSDLATEINLAAADVTGNSRISVQDALFIAQCSAQLPNSFCPAD